VKEHPALKGLIIPRTGQGGMAATLVTKTLLVSGEPRPTTTSTGRRGAMLRAYDKATGQDVGGRLHGRPPEGGAPMTYMHNGQAVHRAGRRRRARTQANCWRSSCRIKNP